ncbi:5659_t:CDS:1, partial [Entrophospora sp. SA101]
GQNLSAHNFELCAQICKEKINLLKKVRNVETSDKRPQELARSA